MFELAPEVEDVVHHDDIGIEEDSAVHLRKHRVYEQPGRGADSEHAKKELVIKLNILMKISSHLTISCRPGG